NRFPRFLQTVDLQISSLLFAVRTIRRSFPFSLIKLLKRPIIHRVLSSPADHGLPSNRAEAPPLKTCLPIPATQRASSPACQVRSPRETLRACREVGWRAGETGEAYTVEKKRHLSALNSMLLGILRQLPLEGIFPRRSRFHWYSCHTITVAFQVTESADLNIAPRDKPLQWSLVVIDAPFAARRVIFSLPIAETSQGQASVSRGDSSPPGHP
ncbi:hypothetical protein CSPX01_08962, partial [Colletotrichum filicis]